MSDNYNKKRDLFGYLKRLTVDSDFSNSILIYGSEYCDLLRSVVEFIKTIYCTNSEFYCNNCSQCKLISEFSHPNIRIFFPLNNVDIDNGSTYIKIFEDFFNKNDVVNLNSWSLSLKSQKKQMVIPKSVVTNVLDFVNSDYLDNNPRICLIWGPELLNLNSANSILKILEEPKRRCFFLLVSENIDNILATIKSRVLKVFIDDYFEFSVDNDMIVVFLEILRVSYSLNYENLYLLIDKLLKYEKNIVINVFKNGLYFLLDLLHFKLGLDVSNKYNDQLYLSLKKLGDIIDVKFIENVANILENAIFLLNSNSQLRITLYDVTSKISEEFRKNNKNLN